MTDELLTAKEVAALLHISEDQVKRRTKSDKWPHVKFSGKTIRYRSEHVEWIVAQYEQTNADRKGGLSGQTAASRRRAS